MTYNTNMSMLPVSCPLCGEENMVDMNNLEERMIDKVASRIGTRCIECGAWINLSYTTRLLEDALRKLSSRSPNSAGYQYHFAKTLKKCEGVQEKYGGL